MGSIKDKNYMGLTEAHDIKKRWQEYTEELYKKDLHDPDSHKSVITHLISNILRYDVTCGLIIYGLHYGEEVWLLCTHFADSFIKSMC